MLVSVLPVNGEEKIYSDMIRLHVIASSDSTEDQQLKLKVRDAVLKEIEEMKLPDDKEASEKTIIENKSKIENAAKKVIEENGKTYPVTVALGLEEYPERHYEGFVLPAGTYTSLRVIINEGEGHNWWCVLYPPLCTTAAESREEKFVAAGFSEEQYKTITETGKTKYKIKFKILEILENLFGNEKTEENAEKDEKTFK